MKQNILLQEWKNNFYNQKLKMTNLKKKNMIKNHSRIITEYNLQSYNRSNQDTSMFHTPTVSEGQWIQKGDLLADCSASVGGELALGQNIFVAYMPWEGYNYEDAILISERLVYDDVYTSIHIEKYEIETRETKFGKEKITRSIPGLEKSEITHLDKYGIIKTGTWVEEGRILIGKVSPINPKYNSQYQKLLYAILEKPFLPFEDTSVRAPRSLKAKVIDVQHISTKIENLSLPTQSKEKIKKVTMIDVQHKKKTENKILPTKIKKKTKKENLIDVQHKSTKSNINKVHLAGSNNKKSKTNMKKEKKSIIAASFPKQEIIIDVVKIYLAEKRKIQIGDKMAGRHGNKGIVSKILPRQDMPYLPDGTPIDMVLNPLGVPSRMNVGQIYECLLGLAGKYLGEYFRVPPFDEIYGPEASRSLVYSKLYEAKKIIGVKWLFDPNIPGKMYLYDGRTGESFDQAVTVGQAYMLKLVHLVDDKIHARSTGPYSLVTQQPLRGRSKQGGQRLGEMEVWALEGYGAAFTLLEMLTIKSDDLTGRLTLWSNVILNTEIYIGTPESFKVLVCELQALCLDVRLFRLKDSNMSRFPNLGTDIKKVKHLMQLP